MNSNRGQYSFTPMYNLKNKKNEPPKEPEAGQEAAPAPMKRYGFLAFVMALVLPALFWTALLVPNFILRCVFLGAAAVSVLIMWMLRAFVRSARNTLTVIYAALALVIALALFINAQTPENRGVPASSNQPSPYTNPDTGSVNAMLNEINAANAPEATATPVPEPAAYTRLKEFLAAWSENMIPTMKEYCYPGWVNEQLSAENTLFQMLNTSIPTEYVDPYESITGSEGDTSRIITIKVYFNESGRQTLKRLNVIMKKVNDIWYVDPDSLEGVVVDEAAEAAAAANADMPHTTVTPRPDPTDETEVLIVYYNVNGGKYYHLDRTCPAVSSEYWPLTGKIPFDMINSAQYSKLKPCEKCAAPTRPPQ